MEELLKNDKEDLFIEKSKHRFIKVFITIFLILELLGGGGYYYYTNYYNNPNYAVSTIFKNLTKETKKDLKQAIFNDKIKVNALIDMNLETNDKESEILKEIFNNLSLQLNAQLDTKVDIYNIDLNSKYKNDDFIKINAFMEDNHLYVKPINLFDKYIKISNNEEIKKVTNKNFRMEDVKNLLSGLAKSLEEEIKKVNFEREKQKLTIDNQEYEVFNNYTILKDKQIKAFKINLLTNLQENNDFVHSFEKLSDKKLIEIIDETKKDDINGEYKICFYTTTSLINSKLVSIQIDEMNNDEKNSLIIDRINNQEILIREISADLNTEMRIKYDNKVFNIENKVQTKDNTILKTNIKLNIDEIKDVNKPDTSNSININKLTEEDVQSIEEKLANNKALVTIINLIQSKLKNNT